jgi:hypothetical protein
MSKLSKAELMKLLRERSSDPTRKPFNTEADKRAAKGKKARRKGEAFQKLIAADLQKIGQPFGFDQGDIWSRSVTGHGDDIVFTPYVWNRFGRPRIECKHYIRKVDAEKIFKKHADKCAQKDQHTDYKGVPILVHRCNYQPIMVTMRQDDLITLSGDLPEDRHRTEELVTVPWQGVLQVLARKVAAGGPVEPDFEVEDSEEIQF